LIGIQIAAPVGVAAEEAGGGLARHVFDQGAADTGHDTEIAFFGVDPADAAHAIG
jgi:hypothetical protein